MSSEGIKNINELYEKIKSIVELSNEYEAISAKVVSDTDSGIIKIYSQDTGILKRASSSIYDLVELSYSTSEHHPYWPILYNGTEVLKTILDKWESDLSKEDIDEILWRIEEMKTASQRIKPK